MNNFDDLLEQVMDEARRADIPISKKIFPHIKVNSRAKSRFGRCIRENDGRFMIELSSRLYDAPEHSCRQTLAHELIHTCEGCMNHGELFRRYAEKMNRKYGYNIKRTNSAEEMGVESGSENGKYIVVCKKCGKEIRRTRQSPLTKNPSQYRCVCEGELYLRGPSVQTSEAVKRQAKYIIICTSCGARFEREKMSRVVSATANYRCRCGGRLKRIK